MARPSSTHSAPEAARADREPPSRIGRFVVIKEVGDGAMGTVYAAYDDVLDRKVAVKLLHASHARSEEARARLLREAQTIARLSHPNVIQVYEVGTFGDRVFVAMEFVDGITLRTLQEDPSHTWREILDKYVAAGRGLAAAHAAGIVHRDFKPDNVLVGKDGQVRVLDFGLARSQAEEDADRPERADVELSGMREALATDAKGRPLTRTGAILGTPAYMAPEQYTGEPADPKTDQFGFTVALYEGLYGVRPFPGDTLASLATHVLDGYIGDPPPYTKVPPWLRRVVLRGLKVDPQGRYRNMDELLADLGRDPWALFRRILVVAAVLLAVAAVGFSWWSDRQQGEARLEGDRLRAEFESARMMSIEDQIRAARGRSVAEKWDELVLAYARTALERDPTESLAALKHLTPDNEWWLPAARTIAGEAQRLGVVQRRISTEVGGIRCLTFSPDGARVAAGSGEGVVLVWRLDSAEGEVLSGHRGAVNALAFSSDSGRVVTAGNDGTVRIWPLEEKRGRVLRGHDGAVWDVAFSPDGKTVASAGQDGTVRLWDLETGESRAFVNHTDAARGVDFSPDGTAVASASADGTVRIWLLDEQRSRLLKGHDSGARDVWFSPDGAWLTSLDGEGHVRQWSVPTGKATEIKELAGAKQIDQSGDGSTWLATRGDSGLFLLHETDPESRQLLGLAHDVTAVALSRDGRLGASATDDGEVQVWSAAMRRPAGSWRGDAGVEAMTLTRDGARLVMATSDGAIGLWDLGTGEKRLMRHHDCRIDKLALAPDGLTLAALDERGVLSLWDLEALDVPPRTLRIGAEPTAKALAWSSDGRWLALSGCGAEPPCRIRIHRPADGATREVASVDGWVSMLAFGPQANMLLSDDPDGAGPPRVWGLDDGSQQILRTPDDDDGRRLAFVFMEDGAAVRVATSSTADDETETLRVWHWDVGSGSTHILFERAGLQAVQAARGMHTLIIQTVDGRALLWHLQDDVFRVLPPMEGIVRSFDISPDGRTILTGRWGSGRDDQRFEWMVDVASGQGQQLRTLFTPLAWSLDGRTVADVYRRREIRLWRDPAPDAPREFLAWLDRVTDMTIERSRLR